ncbi:hypothetical protein S4A8_12649 [Salinisphaera sp. S4-8]
MSSELNKEIGRRLVELSMALGEQGKWIEGARYLSRSLPVAEQYDSAEKQTVIAVYLIFSKEIETQNAALAKTLRDKVRLLKK